MTQVELTTCQEPPKPDELLPRSGAAAFLGVKTQTLAAWATSGRYGLPFIKVGCSVRYRRTDLERWLVSRTATSTGTAK